MASWKWKLIGTLPHTNTDHHVIASGKVFYSRTTATATLHWCDYPGLGLLGSYTFTAPKVISATTLRGTTLYVSVWTSDSLSQIYTFDTTNPGAGPSLLFSYTSIYSNAVRGNWDYNAVDDRIYQAANSPRWDGTKYVNGLVRYNPSTGTFTPIANYDFGVGGQQMVAPMGITATPDGGVWYFTTISGGSTTYIRRYDIYAGTVSSYTTPVFNANNSFRNDPLALPDSSVLVWANSTEVYRFVYSGGAISMAAYPQADLADLGDSWHKSFGFGGPGRSWVFDEMNVWTYQLDAPPLRMKQRDDVVRAAGNARNRPRSQQRSIRAGGRNRYV